ncbi:ABC transporter permease [Cellulomonas bogoriensis]|uniref:ABC transporter permease n=1 Tax=Cellulomonas bogoriensis 69B4 = DSM 16987 TaxID=1386082 RepID=A0A0A0C1P8_9CELL|nr:ABC transporter permease [Cellulomonas bogoriensis]KGM13892.1 ABC transporter permease [Cellulomonas bogoriensis 69B4 = DSM 16987]
MLAFLGRRLLSSAVVLLGATFIVYMLLSIALDPLEELYASSAPNREQLIESRIDQLNLDTPAAIRYLMWLQGAAGCLIGQCDLGTSWVTGQSVTAMLGSAFPATATLVSVAIVVAIALGVTVGIASALRQYTGFDYGVTFMSFVLYSLPSFWVAVLLKLWGAIGFNDFLADPVISPQAVAGISLIGGLVWQAIVGGAARRRAVTFLVAAGATAAMLTFISATGWLLDPSLGPVAIGVVGVAIAFGVTALSAGLRNRRALHSALTVVALGLALYYPLQFAFQPAYASGLLMVGLAVVAAGSGLLVGWLFGGPDRGQSMRGAAITAVLVGALIAVDRLMQVWQLYSSSSRVGGRPIATIGSQTPGLSGDYWIETMDTFTHLVLPTIALILISFASYTRYSRASLLEVMNQDYIRTARAKGLPERVVTVRHAFRNALIPLATIVPLDIANLFGGAIITERIFAWSGMGTMFITGLDRDDANPIMGYFVVVGMMLVVANIIVDLVYAALDPRIRVNA